ncbi:MAG: CheR family methyltransferase [Solirubrobacteraceae bacterium]
MSTETDGSIEQLLEFLKTSRGFDFTGYKRSSLERRIGKRMEDVGLSDHAAYTEYLELHPGEFEHLFNTILINVTAFFRDADAWEQIRQEILPPLLASIPDDEPIRVWSAACASGEEAYTVAMVLTELLGEQTFKDRVKIYATDVDDEALQEARAAVYSSRQVEGLDPDLLARYFERDGDRFQFRSDLRRAMIFGRNDLVQDAPISRVDLLLCRNALMYFNAETQAQIVRRFHFALNPRGVLLLGRSETLLRHGDLFEPIDLRIRTFRKLGNANIRDGLRRMARGAHDTDAGTGHGALRDQAFDLSPGAQVVFDAAGVLIVANQEARDRFEIDDSDIGRPLQDLAMSYRPVELRGHIDRVMSERRPLRLSEAVGGPNGATESVFEVRISPLTGADEALIGTAVTFVDITAEHHLQHELDRSRHELQTAYEELQSTVEELETTNEELQSTNEELETTNEELQSSNEELETMNEELQSTNEELQTINDEVRERSSDLDDVNAFLETILTSLGMAIAVVDRQGVVAVWNSHASDLWGLRGDEVVGHHLLGLDIGLPVEQLKPLLTRALGGAEPRGEIELDAVNRRGRALRCHVTVLPLTEEDAPSGAVVLMNVADPA